MRQAAAGARERSETLKLHGRNAYGARDGNGGSADTAPRKN